VTEVSPYAMTPLEIAWNWVFGHEPVGEEVERPDEVVPPAHPRATLERLVARALERPPCGVAFSGGRDSSLVLAVATHVARREGLPDPVPLTKLFPDAPDTFESDWQELVVGHLGLADWQRIELRDEMDFVGPLAADHLRRYGVVWPPSAHADVPLWSHVRGGTLLDGEGGDEVLGVNAHRIGPLVRLVGSPRPLQGRRIRRALRALAPAPIRIAHLRRSGAPSDLSPWLRPAARRLLVDELARAEAAEPLWYHASVVRVPRERTVTLAARTVGSLAREHDVVPSSPLLDPEFVAALARHGGRFGAGDRTQVLRSLASDLLPDALLSRTTKTEFSGAFWAASSREFIARWDGSGVDVELVDAEVLARELRSGNDSATAAALLQHAWLAA
jgi:asparagine synthase (glutamine-hydrolysing)